MSELSGRGAISNSHWQLFKIEKKVKKAVDFGG